MTELRPHRTFCGMDYHEPDNDSACSDPECPGRECEDDSYNERGGLFAAQPARNAASSDEGRSGNA